MKQPKLRFPEFTGDWKQHKFEDVVTIGSGKDYKHLESGNVPVYGTGGYMLSVNQALSESEDAIGIGRKGTIDKPYILRAPFWTVDTLFYCIPNEGFDLTFTNCLFQNVDWKKKDESTGVPSLSKVIINNVKTYVPSLEEQQKIAFLFTELDSLIQSAEKELEGYRELKQGMLQKMFPKKGEKVPEIRFPEFTGDWEQRKLGDIADVTKLAGFEFTKHVVYSDEGNIIALRGLNIKNGQLILDDVKYIDGSNFSKLSRSKLFIDDIMFTYVGTVGEVAIIKENDRFYLAPNVSRIRVKSDDSPKFISHYMRTDNFKNKVIFPLIATSSQPALSMENIRKFTINIPTNREEQDRLAKYFDNLDNLITLQQRELDVYKELKKGLLQQMFC